MRRLILIAFLTLFAAPAFALTDAESALVKKAETYLNGIGTLKARFTQVNADGSSHEGDLYISRPGKMRLVGDVDYASVLPVAGGITPVPGGVGPMTIAVLLRNTLVAAHRNAGIVLAEGAI